MLGPIEARGIEHCYKRMAEIGGLDPKEIKTHSTRVGIAQELVARGASSAQIAQACGWKGDVMPARYASKLKAEKNAVASLLI